MSDESLTASLIITSQAANCPGGGDTEFIAEMPHGVQERKIIYINTQFPIHDYLGMSPV